MPRVHYCFSQHLNEVAPPRRCTGVCRKNKKFCECKRCRCRQKVSQSEARRLVESGQAQWIIIRKDPVQIKRICQLCANDDILKKSCSNCNKSGEITETVLSPVRGNDIVMISTGSGEPGHEVFRSVMSKQTPRVATIDHVHICRAYINGYQEDIDRINEYGKMDSDFLKSLIVPFIPDPNEGRVLFPFGPDERSFPKPISRR